MALTWEWKNLSGTITEINYGKEHTFNFYEGNALMIVLNEYKDENGEDMYNLHWFFCDEAHAKNCLGLAKGHENMLEENSVKNITVCVAVFQDAVCRFACVLVIKRGFVALVKVSHCGC